MEILRSPIFEIGKTIQWLNTVIYFEILLYVVNPFLIIFLNTCDLLNNACLEKGSEYLGSAVCETLHYLSIYLFVQKELIRSIPNPFRGTHFTSLLNYQEALNLHFPNLYNILIETSL